MAVALAVAADPVRGVASSTRPAHVEQVLPHTSLAVSPGTDGDLAAAAEPIDIALRLVEECDLIFPRNHPGVDRWSI